MNETQLVRACIDYLLIRGHFVWRNNSGVTATQYTNKLGNTSKRIWRAGKVGSSDILGVAKNGKFIAIECKVGKNKPSEAQNDFLQQITERGGIARVIYTLEELMNDKTL